MSTNLSKKSLSLLSVAVGLTLLFSACTLDNPISDDLFIAQQLDTTVPTVAISSVTTTDSAASVSVVYRDASGVRNVQLLVSNATTSLVLDRNVPGNPTNGVWIFSVPLAPNTYSLSAQATDRAGNVGRSSMTNITITSTDTTRPTVSVTSPTHGQSVSDTANLAVTLSDNSLLGSFFYRINNGSWVSHSLSTASTNLSIPLTFSQGGNNTIDLYATDGANNSSATNTIEVVVDTSAPTITITSPLNGTLTNSTSLQVSGTSSVASGSISSVHVSLDGSVWHAATGTTSWSHTIACAEGTNTVRARAITAGGRTNTTHILVIIDTTRPTATITTPANNQVLSNTSVSIAGTASDTGSGIAETFLRLNSGGFAIVGTTSFSINTNIVAGAHTASVFTRDRAGNFSLTNNIAFTIALATNTNVPPPSGGYVEYNHPHSGTGRDIILQGFHWASTNGTWWNTISANAGTIAAAGFTMVWLPPISDAGDNAGYLPRRWYNLSSRYGTPAQLSNAISTLRAANIRVIADIVVNHRVGTLGWGDFSEPSFPDNRAAVTRTDEWPATHGGPGTGAADTGTDFHAGRDLDHTNPHVRAEIINWLRWKRQLGFDGWRYDFVRGFDATFVSNYNEATRPYFSVGELWPDIPDNYYASGSGVNWHRQLLMDWINRSGGKSTAFDFTTKWQLMLAVSRTEYWRLRDPDGRPIGAIGWWPAMSVTFIDNHDTGPSPGGGQNHWPFPQAQREIGYAYILTHPGTPSVYWFDYFDSGSTLRNQINTLIAIRRAQNIRSTSPITILRADANEYVAMINSNTIVKLGPGMAFTTTWPLAASGHNWAVWTNR